MQFDSPVRLAGPPEMTTECALPALAGLVADGLGLEITLGRPAERLLDRLAAGWADIVLSTMRPDPESFAVTRLPDEQFVLVAAPVWSGQIDPAGPDGVPLIAVGKAMPVIRRYWRALYGALPATPPAVVVDDLRAVRRLVCAGAGMTVLPRYLCKDQLSSGELVDAVKPARVPGNELFLARRHHGANPATDLVHDYLLDSSSSW